MGIARMFQGWRTAAIILLLGAALVGGVQVFPKFDNGTKFMATAAAVLLTGFLLSIWVLFFAGFGQRRWWLLLILIVPAVARIDGCAGDLQPSFAWRWAPKKDAALVGQLPAASAPVDVSKTSASDFPQFLGPTRNGVVPAERLATDWSTPPRCLWRQPIGAGWSAFAVVGDYAVTQEQRGEQELVVCYELRTGKIRWTHADADRYSSVMGGDGPRATPTIDGGRVYALGAKGLLNCLDGATGKVIWSQDVVTENQATLPMWAKSCSPLVVDDKVIVSAGGTHDNSLVAYQKDSGTLLWHAGDAPSSYASPVLTTINGVRQIVMVNEQDVTAHDLATGKILWLYEWPGQQPKVPDPVPVGGNRVLISAGYGLGAKLLEILPDKHPAESTREIWGNLLLKPKFTNLLVRDGYVYGIDDGIALMCVDIETGKRKWKGGRYGHGQLLLVGDLILVQAEEGDIVLVEATPKRHHELTRFTALHDKTWNNPALAGRHLIVRNHVEAACFELPLESAEQKTAAK